MDKRVQKVIALMEEDLQREFSPEEIARFVNLSPSRLRHLFKNETGMTLANYLKALRMRKAKEMIETTFMRVKEIINLTGSGNRTRFTKDFKRAYGLTPTRYRKHYLSNKPD